MMGSFISEYFNRRGGDMKQGGAKCRGKRRGNDIIHGPIALEAVCNALKRVEQWGDSGEGQKSKEPQALEAVKVVRT